MSPGRIVNAVTAVAVSGVLVAACAPEEGSVPALDQGQVARGGELYQQNCASCHRADLSGDPNWKTPNPDGSYPPPPHDSSGHTWHHSDRLLLEIIRDGSDFPESRMPTFSGSLTDEAILAIIEYLKANWGQEERDYQWQVTWQEAQRSPRHSLGSVAAEAAWQAGSFGPALPHLGWGTIFV
jgi:mono/diheme cytochrome c family protein